MELTRKDLKTDKFAEEVSHGFEFLTHHTAEVKKYGAIVVAVAVLAGGVYFYRRHAATVRGDALSQALRIVSAKVGPPQPPTITYATEDEKEKAKTKALADVAATYHGTNEGAIAGLYLGVSLADKGDVAAAEKQFRDVVDSAPKDLAAVGSLSLAQLLASEGKDAEAVKLLQDIENHPSTLVSKEQAQLERGTIVGKKNLAEGRKIIEPLTNGRTAVSQAAVTALGALSQN